MEQLVLVDSPQWSLVLIWCGRGWSLLWLRWWLADWRTGRPWQVLWFRLAGLGALPHDNPQQQRQCCHTLLRVDNDYLGKTLVGPLEQHMQTLAVG